MTKLVITHFYHAAPQASIDALSAADQAFSLGVDEAIVKRALKALKRSEVSRRLAQVRVDVMWELMIRMKCGTFLDSCA